MSDTISRQAAIELWEEYHPYIAVKACEYGKRLRSLPSAERHGRWIIDKEFSNIGACSICGDRWGSVDQMNYCPSCGAKMEGEQDE